MLAFLKWDEREPYEKIIMAGLFLVTLLVMVWFLLVSPVLSAKQQAEQQSAKAMRDYGIVSRAAPFLGQKTASSGAAFSRTVLINTAREESVKLSRVQPDGESLLVWMDDVPTHKFYGFIETLMVDGGAELTRATISSDESGALSVQLSLK